MPEQQIKLTQLKRTPERVDWETPRDEVLFQLGCTGCSSKVCFKAKGVRMTNTESPIASADDVFLIEATDQLEKGSRVKARSSRSYLDPCEGPCPQIDDMQVVVGMLNERFSATLSVPTE